MSFDVKEHLKVLCTTAAPAGHEGPVAALVSEVWSAWVDDWRTDRLGNVIAMCQGGGPEPRRRIMLCAHMDEIGLIVSEVCEGFIRTAPLGGIDYRVLLMQPVWVHGRRRLKGLFGAAPPHMSRRRDRYPEAADLWIDVGLPPDEVAALVRVGDLVTIDAPATALKHERLAAKSLDNRVSLAVIALVLEELSRRTHAWDVVAVAAAQEEVGSYGAMTAAYQTTPDIAIVLDGSYGRQRGVRDDESFELGKGPTIGRGPNLHPLLEEALREVAGDLELVVQTEPFPGNTLTDAWELQVSREGIPTALVSIPMRNMHTPSEVIDWRDVTRAARLLAAFIARLAPDFLDEIAWPLPTGEEDEA